jgi:hypothetical protein
MDEISQMLFCQLVVPLRYVHSFVRTCRQKIKGIHTNVSYLKQIEYRWLERCC